jgi:hypothetical protein
MTAASNMSATGLAAWIGVITGVGALLWNVYAWWHSGPRLTLEAFSNLFPGGLPVAPTIENRCFLQIKVYNRGDRKTTLTRLALTFYPTRWSRWRGHSTWEIDPPAQPQILPYDLDAGSQWTSVQIRQTEELVRKAQTGYLLGRVFHGASEKPAVGRILISEIVPMTTERNYKI